jgi:hypothetical protein
MCQKAFGGPYGALVSAPEGLVWTRGAPTYFQSSNRVRRGFCSRCGTPLTFEPDVGPVELAIVAFDDPDAIAPVIQMSPGSGLPWAGAVGGLPTRTPAEADKVAGYYASVVSFQHPDHDTDQWPGQAEHDAADEVR